MGGRKSRWAVHNVPRDEYGERDEVETLRRLVSHRELAYFDTLSHSKSAKKIGERAKLLADAKDALARAKNRSR